METQLTHSELLTKSIISNLSDDLVNKIDIYMCNVDLTDKQKLDLIRLFEKTYMEVYSKK